LAGARSGPHADIRTRAPAGSPDPGRDPGGHRGSSFKVARKVSDLSSKQTRAGSYTIGPDGDLVRVGG
jgi:hypothetical protein